MPATVIVVPCYNEGRRLAADRFLTFLRRQPGLRLLFVDDGSSDDTLDVLHRLQDRGGAGMLVQALPRNRGKAEAVRQGCLAGFAAGADLVGYWDADLATPLESIPDFVALLGEHPRAELVCGARVQLLGRSIRRSRLRHYLGRVFATAVSWTLGLKVYDTQCGAKLFRASPRMRAVFVEPFLTRWLFDVEILARLVAAGRRGTGPRAEDVVHELPLRQWHDVPGSKVKASDFFKAILELCAIHRKYLGAGVSFPVELAPITLPFPAPPQARAATRRRAA